MKEQKQKQYRNAANLNEDTAFPYFVRRAENQVFSAGDVGFGVMHWHEDLQFIYVQEGMVCVKTLEEEEILSAGEAVFTNKGVIHYSVGRSRPCRYILFRFPERFLYFYPGSAAEKLTRHVTDHPGLSLVPLLSSMDWCSQALQILQRLADLEDKKDPGSGPDPVYEYEVLAALNQVWGIMLRHMDLSEIPAEDPVGLRMRRFLEYIESNLAGDIRLDEMAASAGVSKSEALRCFRQTLQTTPYRYVMDVRLSRAADLLAQTRLPVGEVADRTGFHQQSYFGKCFREKTGLTPLQYRRKAAYRSTSL
ncbi:MAG: helix-turn-helix domain-containing protein [Firmicutes bacterium]|nr:helix-turn-helix domain-containing protein [Bacillota bacterium]